MWMWGALLEKRWRLAIGVMWFVSSSLQRSSVVFLLNIMGGGEHFHCPDRRWQAILQQYSLRNRIHILGQAQSELNLLDQGIITPVTEPTEWSHYHTDTIRICVNRYIRQKRENTNLLPQPWNPWISWSKHYRQAWYTTPNKALNDYYEVNNQEHCTNIWHVVHYYCCWIFPIIDFWPTDFLTSARQWYSACLIHYRPYPRSAISLKHFELGYTGLTFESIKLLDKSTSRKVESLM